MDTVLECSVCLDSLPPDSGECEVTDYVAHYCGLACYVRWHQHESAGPQQQVPITGLELIG